MLKSFKFIIALCIALVAVTGISVTVFRVSAYAITPTSAGIQITLTKEDNAAAVTSYTADMISVTDAADQVLAKDTDYQINVAGNVYTITGLSIKQTYNVTFTSTNGESLSVAVPITSFSTTNKAVKVKCVNRSNFDAKKVGVLGGFLVNSDGVVKGSVTVKAISGTTTYTTTSSAIGAYKLYVPIGAYSLVVVGKDTQTDYKNTVTPVNVIANQMCGPATDQNPELEWGTGENTLGLTVNEIHGSDLTITGVANSGVMVSAFAYNSATSKLTLLASTVAAKAILPATTGAYKITLPDYQPGQNIVIRAKDKAGNSYDCITYKTNPIALNSMSLTADSTAATIGKPIEIKLADSANLRLNSYLQKRTTAVAITYDGTTTTLAAITQYTVTAGKITILAGVFKTARTYTIKVSATGYNQGSVDQVIGISTTIPPTTITGTFTIKAGGGSALGTAQFTSIGTAGTGNKLAYTVSDKSAIQVMLGNTLTGYTSLAKDTDITNLSITSTKYIHVYEIDDTDRVVKAKSFTLTAAQIKATGTAVTSGTVTATCSALNSKTGPVTITLDKVISGLSTSDIVVKKDGNALTLGSHYNISGETTNTITLTFSNDANIVYNSSITVLITKTNFTINGGQEITVSNEMGKPIGVTNNGLYFADGSTTFEFTGESFQTPPAAECYTVKKDGVLLVNNTDYTVNNYRIQFLSHAALVPTNIITVEIRMPGYSFANGLPVTIANNIKYIITATSNGISSATGTTTISMNAPIQGLAAGNISVAVFGQGEALDPSTYVLSDLTGSSFTITFLDTAGLVHGSNDILVTIAKVGYNVNEGVATVVKNNIP